MTGGRARSVTGGTVGRAAGGARAVTVAALVCWAVVATAAPAAADPAGPTHYRSTILAVEGPGADAVDLEVLGGDSFLVLHVRPGTTVEVPGYEGEPYVRIGPDGTVEVNERSPARWLNDARYGEADVEVPQAAAAAAPPLWALVGRDGTYAWHDHRIHWMSPAVPSHVDPTAAAPQPVMEWAVPLVVDGQEVVVRGELNWLPGPTPVVPVVLVVGLLGAAVAVVLRRPAVARGLTLVAAGAGLAVGTAQNIGLPPGADGEPATVVLPVLAAAAVGLGGWRRRRSAGPAGTLLTAAGGVPVLVWAIVQAGALTRPIVPGPLPVGVVRVVVAAAIAAGVAALVAGGRTVLALTSLDADAGDAEEDAGPVPGGGGNG